jgi:hypothetical protein
MHLVEQLNSEGQQICQILGFKIANILAVTQPDQNKDPKDVVPVSLLILVAFFIREDKFSVESFWPYLVKQNKVNGKFEDAPDVVDQYHNNLQKVLDH